MENTNEDKRTASRVVVIPDPKEVEAERNRLHYNRKFLRTLYSTISVLVVVAATAILLAMLFVPLLQVSGSSMAPTLSDGDVVMLTKHSEYETEDIVGFYYQDKIMLKRVIGVPGDIINVDEKGNVILNGETLDEPYATDKSWGDWEVELPYKVPEGYYFVLGDNRATSVDSRSYEIGCAKSEQIVGKVFIRIWPITFFS